MHLDLEIPDDLAGRLGASGIDVSRRALEAFALEEYKAERISKAELRRVLSISRYELDGWLKAHDIWIDYTLEDFHLDCFGCGRRDSVPSSSSAALISCFFRTIPVAIESPFLCCAITLPMELAAQVYIGLPGDATFIGRRSPTLIAGSRSFTVCDSGR